MTEVETLKIRLFDLGEQASALQSALNEIARMSEFKGDNTKDLIEHLKGFINTEVPEIE